MKTYRATYRYAQGENTDKETRYIRAASAYEALKSFLTDLIEDKDTVNEKLQDEDQSAEEIHWGYTWLDGYVEAGPLGMFGDLCIKAVNIGEVFLSCELSLEELLRSDAEVGKCVKEVLNKEIEYYIGK